MTGPGHHEQTSASATLTLPLPGAEAPAAARAETPRRAAMRPAVRRLVYVGSYEALSVLATTVVLSGLLGHQGGASTITAIAVSTVATIWNFVWNTIFEAMERRYRLKGRGWVVRAVHAVGYEGGLLIATVPMVALILGVGFVEALMIESGMLVFFLIFTYVYSWAFDRIFGLPESAQ
ncbi:PACE efflux transporter [Leucobacter sp. M11]|uniref:PACE efflux transporter n=1 Tax=Leucobacter sp. M11 TaxID=2993565 RepID=UPI002D80BEC3|nr:PACE efflux transporter [Leucobacter sp. M11]MEB4613501.1 PACE efflux transporter [Leucobacter sp. M11]